jgi:UDP-N-acetyl-2-amino-2-deoxyglucuronate dehydrogenase
MRERRVYSYSLALIGCGRISYKHIDALVENQDRVDLVACCDPQTELAKAKKDDYTAKTGKAHDVAVYADYRQMLGEITPDIVAIATESGRHARIALDAFQAGCQVLTEKPMALSTADATEMIDAAKAADKTLGVCFQNRFNGPIQRLRTAVDAGRFGRLLHGQIQIRWNRNLEYYRQAPWRGTWEQDGGTLMNQCTHGVDLLQWLMDSPVRRIHGVTRRFQRPIEAEDFGAAILEFESGAVGVIEGTANVYPTNINETLSLFGETGTVVIGGIAVNKIETWRFADATEVGDLEEQVISPDAKDPPSVYGFGHSALYRDYLDALDEGRPPLVSGEEGRRAVDVVLGIYESMKTGKPVDLPSSFSTKEMAGVL